MRATIAKWGNSLALRLPHGIAADAGLHEGASVDLRVAGERLVVAPARPRYNLEVLSARMKPARRHKEIEWGGSRGDETW